MDCSIPGLPVHHQLPEFYSNSCPLSRWCHLSISSSVVPFSSCLQSFPASRSFPVSQFFTSGGQSIRVSEAEIPGEIIKKNPKKIWKKIKTKMQREKQSTKTAITLRTLKCYPVALSSLGCINPGKGGVLVETFLTRIWELIGLNHK